MFVLQLQQQQQQHWKKKKKKKTHTIFQTHILFDHLTIVHDAKTIHRCQIHHEISFFVNSMAIQTLLKPKWKT